MKVYRYMEFGLKDALGNWFTNDINNKNGNTLNLLGHAGGGTLLGTISGGITGNLIGRSKQRQAALAARNAASQGFINKMLNTFDPNRLHRLETEARNGISLRNHTLTGMGIGGGVGLLSGLGSGFLSNQRVNSLQEGHNAESEMWNRERTRMQEQARKDEEHISNMQKHAQERMGSLHKLDKELDKVEDERDALLKEVYALRAQNREYEERVRDQKSEIAQYKVELDAKKRK